MVITVAFIGYVVGGPLGSIVAALATFVTCNLFTIILARYFRRFSKNPSLKAFVDGVTAAATGAIAGAAFVLGKRAMVDVATVLIALGTFAIMTKFKKVQEPLLIVAAAAVGLALKRVGAPFH